MSTIPTTIRWLSIITGALSLFYLGNAWFEFGLGEVFARIYAWYAGILHPVVELLKPVALLLVGWLGWALPDWWSDGVVLYAMMGGATSRGLQSYRVPFHDSDGTPLEGGPIRNYDPGGLPLLLVRFVAWPLTLSWAFARAMASSTQEKGFWKLLRKGYVGTSLVEFSKIAAGALIFAALNAGLG